MSLRPKYYYLVPVTGLPADGPVQLGSLVSDPQEVTLPINDYPVPPKSYGSHVQTSVTTNDCVSIARNRTGSFGVFAEFLAQLGSPISGSVEGEISTTTSEDWSFPELTTWWFTPSLEYVRAALNDVVVQNWLYVNRPWIGSTKIYMVTGVKVAHGSKTSMSTLKSRAGNIALGFDTSGFGVPINAGPEGGRRSEVAVTRSFTSEESFVFAFRLQRIKVYASGELKQSDYTKKAILSVRGKDREQLEKVVNLVVDGIEDEDAEPIDFGLPEDEVKDIQSDEASEGIDIKVSRTR